MANVRRKSTSIWWADDLDDALVEREIEEAIIDAYTPNEQAAGVICHVENELKVPFRAEVLGDEVAVVGVKWAEGGGFGLDLVVERNGRRHRIEARSVNLLPPDPKGHLALAAYLKWSRYTHGDDGDVE